jgi:hypothetical protein
VLEQVAFAVCIACINFVDYFVFVRFFAAAGVEQAAMAAWRSAVGNQGPRLLTSLMAVTVAYDIASSRARNHEISEAAIYAISELLLKLTNSVSPHALEIASALGVCIVDSSWPIRDAACSASGVLLSKFPDRIFESAPLLLDTMLDAWFKHLKDAIWSIRKNAETGKSDSFEWAALFVTVTLLAIEITLACGNVQVENILLARIHKFITENLAAKTKNLLPLSMLALAKPGAFVLPAGGRRGGSGWGCCIDCITEREATITEVLLSAVHLLRMLWQTDRFSDAARHMPQLWGLLSSELDNEASVTLVALLLDEVIIVCR